MKARGTCVADEQAAGLAVLTIYARGDLAVCTRVTQVLTLRQATLERFVADLSRFDHREVRGLEHVRGPVMRLSVVASFDGDHELVQLIRFLGRIIDVYKVEHSVHV
ncbi:hypothetical protein WJ438_07360 [Streptomyces sp. GD-15H]|uniref:hypothetical protein n=1 Tax=Streptomyces sp. GD-15H TaxID=3129112 RepID=UPI003252917F